MSNESQLRPGRERKREQFVTDSKSNRKWIIALLAVAIMAAGGFIIWKISNDKPEATTVKSSAEPHNPASANASSASSNAGATQSVAQSQDQVVRIPLADLSDKAKFFEFPASDGRTVRFFAVRSADGIYRAALDACDVCYHAKKGYKQEGDKMICKNCGLSFEVAKVGSGVGGCHPIGIANRVEGNQLVINAKELENRVGYF
jgi:hypothetical protein